jgi:hypothetical protein
MHTVVLGVGWQHESPQSVSYQVGGNDLDSLKRHSGLIHEDKRLKTQRNKEHLMWLDQAPGTGQ